MIFFFQNLSGLAESHEDTTPGIFHGDFHMEFCENRRQLFQAYFRDFSIERMDKPWEAFTGGWFPDNAAKKLGINTSFIQGDYSYVLVRWCASGKRGVLMLRFRCTNHWSRMCDREWINCKSEI